MTTDPILRAALNCFACPQCKSNACGPYRCRFSNITHDEFLWNEGQKLAERDRQRPKWLRDLLTGARDE